MKILLVGNNKSGRFSPFVQEQAEALQQTGLQISWFGVQGHGLWGYLRCLPALRRKILECKPDIVHAHYGLSGLLANLQRRVPVVTTYHGSDINEAHVRPFSRMAMRLSAWNLFVSQKTLGVVRPRNKYTLLPCGVNLCDLQLTDPLTARQRMNLQQDKRYVLFAGAFDNPVKDALLAQTAIEQLHDANVELVELKGYDRKQVTLLMCAADTLLLTSVSEGSPQVVKEAMACGCPIVSVDVGDVRERMAGVKGCYVAQTRQPHELAELLQKALAFEGRTKGKDKIIADGLDNPTVAKRLLEIYKMVLKNA